MKVIQYNQDSIPALIGEDTDAEALDVGGMGPDSIAIQITVSDASNPDTASAQLQGSIDGINYFNSGSPVSIAANGVQAIVASPVYYKFYRLKYAIVPDKAALTNQSVTYTAVEAGPAGEAISIELADPSAVDSPLSISVVDNAIVVSLETDSNGDIITDADALVAALLLDADVLALITVSGTGASPLVVLAETNLSGADSYFTVVERKMVYGSRI